MRGIVSEVLRIVGSEVGRAVSGQRVDRCGSKLWHHQSKYYQTLTGINRGRVEWEGQYLSRARDETKHEGVARLGPPIVSLSAAEHHRFNYGINSIKLLLVVSTPYLEQLTGINAGLRHSFLESFVGRVNGFRVSSSQSQRCYYTDQSRHRFHRITWHLSLIFSTWYSLHG